MAPAADNSDPDNVRALISTDNHLGYLEKDPLRGDDSFRAFEEVLALAKANNVDMVLLGGDLFHDNKPTRRTLVRTMEILRRHCLGDEPISLAVRSNPATVNYMNSSYAVSLPVFIIHGNHDDATGAAGADALSALDILSQANLITYFGKAPDSRRVSITPILLQKGTTKVALYGLGNIRDDVLYETWVNNKQVRWSCPATDEDDDGANKWFSIFLIHQNRAVRGSSKAILDSAMPAWLDYVIWGHEHDSHPELTKTAPPIVQPGSSVATSLAHGESLPKHVVVLDIKKNGMKHRPVPLQTVRQFEFGEVSLGATEHGLSVADGKGIEEFLHAQLEDMITRQEVAFDEKKSLWESADGPTPPKGVHFPPAEFYLKNLTRSLRQPLIRLRVDYSGGFESLNPQRFGQSFVGRVASATEILLFFKKRTTSSKSFMQGTISGRSRKAGTGGDGGADGSDDEDEDDDGEYPVAGAGEGDDDVEIPGLVEYFLYGNKKAEGLKFLELDKLSDAVSTFVQKSENRAIPDYVASYLELQKNKIAERNSHSGKVMTEQARAELFEKEAVDASNRKYEAEATAKKKLKREEEKKKRAENKAKETGEGGSDGGDEDDGGDVMETEKAGESEAIDVEEHKREKMSRMQKQLSANPATAHVAKEVGDGGGSSMAPSDSDSDEQFIGDDDLPPAKKRSTAKAKAGTRGGRAPARGRASARGRAAKTGASAASTRKPPAAAVPKRKASRKAPVVDDDGDDDDDDDEVVVVRRTAKSKSSGRKSSALVSLDFEDEDDDDEPEPAPKKKAAPSRKRKAPESAASERSGASKSRSRSTGRRKPVDTIPLDDSDE